MVRGAALAFWVLWTCSACSLVNAPEERLAPPSPCAGYYGCEPHPCDACDPSASCAGGRCHCLPGYLDPLGDGTRCEPEPGADPGLEAGPNLVQPAILIPNQTPSRTPSQTPNQTPNLTLPPPDSGVDPTPACHNAGDCHVNARCEIDDGEAVCRCAPGYTDQDGACQNVDECELQQHDCGENERCIDTPGAFSCVCTPGYSRVGGQCINDDACAAEPCGAYETCTTLPGSYRCDCAPGYIGDGDNGCIDSEECANGELQCSDLARCESRPGPDACVCRPYYAVAESKSECAERIEFRWWKPVAGRLRVGGGAEGGAGDDLILLDYHFNGDGGHCSSVFTAQPGTDFLLSVLPAYGGDFIDGELVPLCRWARDLHLGGGAIVARALDRRGAVVLDLSLGEGQATIDGNKVGAPGRENLLYFAPGGAFVWAVPIPCEASQTPGAQVLVDLTTDPAGDVYALLRYDATCQAAWNTLPQATSDNVAIVKLAHDTGAVLWARSVVDEPGTAVAFNGLAVAPDGNVYVSGNVYSGQTGFGTTTAASAGFVLALEANGATRWLHPLGDADAVVGLAAGSVDSVHVMTRSENETQVFDAHALDSRDGQEIWETRVATGGSSPIDISSDARGRTIVAVSVNDTGTIGGDPLPDGGGQPWNALIALDASGNVTWIRALVQGIDGINGAQMTPSGRLYVTGRCPDVCIFEPGYGTLHPENFTLGMRI